MQKWMDIADRICYWEAFELFVADIINKEFNTSYIKNENVFWVDLLLNWKNWIEVKQDDKAKETGNYFIETKQYWKISWVLKDDIYVYCIWDYNEFYWVRKEKLLPLMLLHWRKQSAEIGTVWYLVDMEKIKEIACLTYKKENE